MNPSAYIETSVVSYLTARPSRDVVVAAYQEVTREWWRSARNRFELFASELVVSEAGTGDPDASRARLEILEAIPRLRATEDATALARNLIDLGAVLRSAGDDAAHIAIAVTNGICSGSFGPFAASSASPSWIAFQASRSANGSVNSLAAGISSPTYSLSRSVASGVRSVRIHAVPVYSTVACALSCIVSRISFELPFLARLAR